VQKVTTNHQTGTTLSGLAMNGGDVLRIDFEPCVQTVAKLGEEVQRWRVVIVEREVAHLVAEFQGNVTTLAAQVVDEVLVRMIEVQEPV